MFIWDFVADKILAQIVDWFYGQVVGFLGNFFAEIFPVAACRVPEKTRDSAACGWRFIRGGKRKRFFC